MTALATWRDRLPAGVRPYFEKEPLAAFLLGISSGFPYAMIGATLTTRLAQDGIDKKSVTAFSLAFLVYNFKFLWAPLVDGLRLPLIGRLGQRVSWLLLAGVAVMAAVAWLGVLDPSDDLALFAMAAVAVGAAGATYDIVIDAYRIETLRPEQLGVGSGPHGVQTARMIEGIERAIEDRRPDVVLLYGDTNSTLAGAVAAVKLHIPVAHVEAGLRSFNKAMPEEINRIVCDHCSTWLFCPTGTAVMNLEREGFSRAITGRPT